MDDDFMKRIKDLDLSGLSAATAVIDTSAIEEQQRKLDKAMQTMFEYNAQKDAAIFQTAEESAAQTELLDNQLREVKAQNELLRENYSTLKELYDKVKEEAEESRKEAAKSRKREKVAIWVAIASPVVSVLASVLIALFV